MLHNTARAAAMSNPTKLGNHPPVSPTPALSHMLQRLEDANGRMAEKVSLFCQMNYRLLGGAPSEASNKIDTCGGFVAQIEQQIMAYEQFITRFTSELERLSCV